MASDDKKHQTRLWNHLEGAKKKRELEIKREEDLSGLTGGQIALPLPSELPLDAKHYMELYYSGFSKVDRVASVMTVPLRTLKHSFPSKFKLEKFSEIWTAFRHSADDLLHWPMSIAPKVGFQYEYEQLRWYSEVWTEERALLEKSGRPAGKWLVLNVKLSNNGYMYDEHHHLHIVSDNEFRHSGPGWATLDADVYRDAFAPMIQFAKKWIVGSPPNKVGVFSYEIKYNYELRRVDILFWYLPQQPGKQGYPRRHIQITFEPGYPETDNGHSATVEPISDEEGTTDAEDDPIRLD